MAKMSFAYKFFTEANHHAAMKFQSTHRYASSRFHSPLTTMLLLLSLITRWNKRKLPIVDRVYGAVWCGALKNWSQRRHVTLARLSIFYCLCLSLRVNVWGLWYILKGHVIYFKIHNMCSLSNTPFHKKKKRKNKKKNLHSYYTWCHSKTVQIVEQHNCPSHIMFNI